MWLKKIKNSSFIATHNKVTRICQDDKPQTKHWTSATVELQGDKLLCWKYLQKSQGVRNCSLNSDRPGMHSPKFWEKTNNIPVKMLSVYWNVNPTDTLLIKSWWTLKFKLRYFRFPSFSLPGHVVVLFPNMDFSPLFILITKTIIIFLYFCIILAKSVFLLQ